MVDAEDSKSSAARHVGSSPTLGTISEVRVRVGPPVLGRPSIWGGTVVACGQNLLSDSGLVNRNNALTGKNEAVFLKLMRISQQPLVGGDDIAATFWPDG